MPLLDAHHAECLESVGDDAEVLPCRRKPTDDGIAVPRRHRDLVGELAREREPEQTPAQAVGERHGPSGHVRERVVGEVLAGCEDPSQQFT